MNPKTKMHKDAVSPQPPTTPSRGHVHPAGTDAAHVGTHEKGHRGSTHGNPNPAQRLKDHV